MKWTRDPNRQIFADDAKASSIASVLTCNGHCLIPVEKEREQISNNFLSVQVGTVWRDFKIKFKNSMEDEK